MRKIYNSTDNIDFFKTWSSDMAYILGFYTGDGCITKNGNTLVFAFRISSKDRYILEFIRDKINPNRQIQDYSFKQKSGYISDMSVLKISNNIICNDILNLGFKFNKTYNMSLPNIPKEYRPDYVRGYFDADGCSDDKNKRMRISCCSKYFLESLRDYTIKIGKIIIGNSSYDWEMSNKQDVNIFRNYIYNGNFCLERKRQKAYNISYREENLILAFEETKTVSDWAKDYRCNVIESTISRRLEKYKGILSNEKILSLKDREIWNHIPRYIVLSPDKKIYKVSNIKNLLSNYPDLKKLKKLLSVARQQTKCGWSIRSISEEFDIWYEKRKNIKTRSKNELSLSDISLMWDEELIENAEFLA